MSVLEVVRTIEGVDLTVADKAGVVSVLTDVRRVRGWLDSVEIGASRRLNDLAAVEPSVFPEQVMATATRTSVREADRAFRRVAAVELVPDLGRALRDGNTSAGHVHVVTRAVKELNAGQQARFADRGAVLAAAAVELTLDEFLPGGARRSPPHPQRRWGWPVHASATSYRSAHLG